MRFSHCGRGVTSIPTISGLFPFGIRFGRPAKPECKRDSFRSGAFCASEGWLDFIAADAPRVMNLAQGGSIAESSEGRSSGLSRDVGLQDWFCLIQGSIHFKFYL